MQTNKEDKNTFLYQFDVSKRVLQNKLTPANFNLQNATLLSSLQKFKSKVDTKKVNQTEYFQTEMSIKPRHKLTFHAPLTKDQPQELKKSYSFTKSPLSPSTMEEGSIRNYHHSPPQSQVNVKLDKDGRFRLTIDSDSYPSSCQVSDRYFKTLSQIKNTVNQKRSYLCTEQNVVNIQIQQQSSPRELSIHSTAAATTNNFMTQSQNNPSFRKSYQNPLNLQEIVKSEIKQTSVKNEHNFQQTEENQSEQFNQTDRQSLHKLNTNCTRPLNSNRSNQKFYSPQPIQSQQDKGSAQQKLQYYLTHLKKDSPNESSLQLLFKEYNVKRKKASMKVFYEELNNELSENQHKRHSIPKLQAYAKKIQNMNCIKMLTDKKYQKSKELLLKKQKLLKDASNIDIEFLNLESIIQNLCHNLLLFIQLNRNKTLSGKKIKKLYGFNKLIQEIVFDELTGELRNEYTPAKITSIFNQRQEAENNKIQKSQEFQSSKVMSSVSNITQLKRLTKQMDNKQEMMKNMYYFNKNLEEINNEKITENRNHDVEVAKSEAEVIEQKLYELMLQNRVNGEDKKGIFKELKQGILYNNGNPYYRSKVPINGALVKSERFNDKYELTIQQ